MKCLKNVFVHVGLLFAGLLLVVSGNTSAFGADKDYAPLIEKDTVLLVRVDMTKIELAEITKHATNIASFFIDALVEDPKQKKQSKEFIPAMVGMFTAQYTPILDNLKKNGVDKFYIVSNTQNVEMCPFYVAVPVGQKTKEQQNEIRRSYKVINEAIPNVNFSFPFVRHGFIFLPAFDANFDDDAKIKEFIQKRFATLSTVKNELIEKEMDGNSSAAIFSVSIQNEDTIKAAMDNIEKMKEAAATSNEPVVKKLMEKLPEVTTNLSKSTVYFVYDVDLKTPVVILRSTMKTKDDVKKVTDFVSSFAKEIGDAVKVSQGDEAGDYTTKLITMFGTPEVKDLSVIWKFDAPYFKKNEKLFIDALKFIQKKQEEMMKQQEGIPGEGGEN